MNYRRIKNLFYEEFKGNNWFDEVLSYIATRYFSIERRVIETFRFVDLNPMNINAFSYEYGSILRDSGSVFGSTMDKLVRATKSIPPTTTLDMRDYRKWLIEKVEKVYLITVGISYPLKRRFLMPFSSLEDDKASQWWVSYNNIKHSDIDKFMDGNLRNDLHSLAALAILFALMDDENGAAIRLFDEVGFFEPSSSLKELLFS